VLLEGESRERFEELLASLTEEWQPRNTTEAALVETMAVARWRYLRVLSLQKVEFDLEIARQPHDSKVAAAALAFRRLADNSRVLDLLLRYEVSFDRQFTRALNALIKLRAVPAMPGQDETPGDETKVAPAAQPPHDLKFPNEPKPPPRRPRAQRGTQVKTKPQPRLLPSRHTASNFQTNRSRGKMVPRNTPRRRMERGRRIGSAAPLTPSGHPPRSSS
jgi:hypothetical protein